MADGFLGIYMNHQLALGVLWREGAARARENRGTELERCRVRPARRSWAVSLPFGELVCERRDAAAAHVDAFAPIPRKRFVASP